MIFTLRINSFMRITPFRFNHLSTGAEVGNHVGNIWNFWDNWYPNCSNIYQYKFSYNTYDASNDTQQYSFFKYLLTLNIGQVVRQSFIKFLKTFIFLKKTKKLSYFIYIYIPIPVPNPYPCPLPSIPQPTPSSTLQKR